MSLTIVIDSNILFSALIKDSCTAELVFNKTLSLFTPDYMIEEFLKYQSYLFKRTLRTKQELIKVAHMMNRVLKVVPESEYAVFIKEARHICPDDKDAMYFALALSKVLYIRL